MRQGLRTLLAVAVGSVGLLAAPLVEAAETAGITITVTVQFLSVSVVDGTIAFGPVSTSTNTINTLDAQVVTNGGNVSETYTLKLTTKDVYTVGETEIAAGADTFVLQALFTGSAGAAPGAGDFGADGPATDDDVVKFSAAQTASATVYAWSANTGDGNSVPAAGVRDLYFKYSAPTSVTTGVEENLVVTITATAA